MRAAIAGLPLQIVNKAALNAVSPNFEIRGEVIIKKDDFKAANEALAAAAKDGGKVQQYANPRNLASGILSRKQNTKKERTPVRLTFIAYALLAPMPIGTIFCVLQRLIVYYSRQTHDLLPLQSDSQWRAIETLKALGFTADQFSQRCASIAAVMEFIRKNNDNRAALPFEIDGVVVKVNSTEAQQLLGRTAHAPRWAMAYKFSAQKSQTKIVGIKLQVGRTGKITPVAQVTPVAVGGTMISRATLHNRDYIEEKKICVGSTVWVERSADVIPKITGLVDPKAPRPAGALQLDWKHCPCAFKSLLVKYEDRVDVFCVSSACPEQQTRALSHFVSRQCLSIDGFGPRTIDDLVDRGFVKDVADIFYLHQYQDQLESLEGWGPRSVEVLLAGIEEGRKNSNLERLLNGLGIVGVGKEIATQLAKHFKTLDRVVSASESDILAAGAPIGPVVASSVYWYFHPKEKAAQEKINDLLGRLKAAGLVMTYSKLPSASSAPGKSGNASSKSASAPPVAILVGRVFVFTGKMITMPRSAASDLVEKLGGEVKSAIVKGVTHLVTGDMTGESTKKLEAAQSKGIEVIDETEFRALCQIK